MFHYWNTDFFYHLPLKFVCVPVCPRIQVLLEPAKTPVSDPIKTNFKWFCSTFYSNFRQLIPSVLLGWQDTHTVKFPIVTILKYTVVWHSVHSLWCRHPAPELLFIFWNWHSVPTKPFLPSPSPTSPWQPPFCFLSLSQTTLGNSCKWNYKYSPRLACPFTQQRTPEYLTWVAFRFWLLWVNAAVNMGVPIIVPCFRVYTERWNCWIICHFSVDYFGDPPYCLSTAAAPFSMPTRRAQGSSLPLPTAVIFRGLGFRFWW